MLLCMAAKLQWNFADWNAKLNGRFGNELGVPVEYTNEELRGELSRVFNRLTAAMLDYKWDVFSSKRSLIEATVRMGIAPLLSELS